jgi:hypothetical protein
MFPLSELLVKVPISSLSSLVILERYAEYLLDGHALWGVGVPRFVVAINLFPVDLDNISMQYKQVCS